MSGYNLSVVARALAFVGLVTIGQAALMILGEIDLSLGVIGGLCGVAAGILMVNYGINPWLAMPIALALGAFYGFLNGGLVSFLRLHSMVLTIGTAGIFGGINLVLTRGVAITNIPQEIQYLGRDDLFGVPMPFVIMLVVLALVSFVTVKTPFGRYMYAIGNDPPAARMLGVKVDRIRILVFVFVGAVSALAGLLMVARLGTAQPSIGNTWVLTPIAAAVIGSFQAVGTLLVFGLLIGPPATAALVARTVPAMMILAIVISLFSVWLGLVISYYADTSGSATMALIPVVLFFLTMIARRIRNMMVVAT